MLRLGKGKALTELAKIVRRNIGTNEGDTRLYIFGLADHDRHSHLYLGDVPNGGRIKRYIDGKGICRVNVGLPVKVPHRPAVGIVASMRTPELLPVTANLITFIYQAMNNKVEFPREPVTRFSWSTGDIAYTSINGEYTDIVLGAPHPTNRLARYYRKVRRGINGWEAYGPELATRIPWLDDSGIQVGDLVRPRTDLPNKGVVVENIGTVRELRNYGAEAVVDFNGTTETISTFYLIAVLPEA